MYTYFIIFPEKIDQIMTGFSAMTAMLKELVASNDADIKEMFRPKDYSGVENLNGIYKK